MKSFCQYFALARFAYAEQVYFWNSMKNKSNNVNFKNKYCYEIKENIPINWIHIDSNGNYSEKISREKALEMKNAYRMRDKASLTSNHILGKAIDMTITWSKDINIKDKTGKEYTLKPNNGAKCEDLHNIGATYGVYKLVKNPPDDPHWSFNGR